eukprot:5354212-Prymnesium_polylepis.2
MSRLGRTLAVAFAPAEARGGRLAKDSLLQNPLWSGAFHSEDANGARSGHWLRKRSTKSELGAS